MLRFLLNDFFKILKEPFNNYNSNTFSKITSNEFLVEELYHKKKFENLWRNKLGYSILKEKYKILSLKVIKDSKIIKIQAKILHSFSLNNYPNNINSKEIQNYIFIVKKINRKNIILDFSNKETNLTLYNKLLKADETYFSFNDRNRLLKEDCRIKFWQKRIHSIDELFLNFSKSFSKYRSNYDESSRNNYNAISAVKYARTYALEYNNKYTSYANNGGDCTNFVSQCIHHGNINFTNIWKPYTNTWLRVNELYYYLLRNNLGKDISKENIYPIGSLIQFLSTSKGFYSHSGIITEKLANGDYLYCCHSYDKLDYPLSEIYPLFYDKFRVIEIL